MIVPVIVLICVKVKITKQTTKENEGFKQDVWGNFKNCKKSYNQAGELSADQLIQLNFS